MQLRRLENPTFPLPLSVIKTHCRIDAENTVDDDLIMIFAWAALRNGEAITGKVWPETSFELSGFTPSRNGEVFLPRSPATAITSILYEGSSGPESLSEYTFTPSTLLPNSNPFIDIPDHDPWIGKLSAPFWPENAKITFSAGWPNGDFPSEFQQWLLVKIAGKYEQREDLARSGSNTVTEFPHEFIDGLLDPYCEIVRM